MTHGGVGLVDGVGGDEVGGDGIEIATAGPAGPGQFVEYDTGDRRLCYAEYGDPNGDPVVFLHGTPGSRHLGALFHGVALDRGVHVLAPDRPGFGRSSAWNDRQPRDAGTWVEPLLADAGVSTARFVAFSGGSADALALGATRSDLVDRLDLVSGAIPPSIARETPPVQRFLGRAAATFPRVLGAAFRGQRRLADRGPASTVVRQYTDDTADVPDEIVRLVCRDFVESCAHSPNGVVTELSWVVGDWDIEPGDVETPVRLWHGDRDANVPQRDARRLCDRLPDGRLTTIEGDHLTTLLASRSDVLGRVEPRD